jgi:tellurite resistance protein
VASSDGATSDEERQKAIRVISNHKDLSSLYKPDEIEKTLDRMLKLAKDFSGKQQLARELDDIKGRSNGAMCDDAYAMAVDIAMADGSISESEQKVLNTIAKRLNVDTAKFEFGL